MAANSIRSVLDTDLYKLTMQCVIHAFYHDVPVTYRFTNRTPELKLTKQAFEWLQQQVKALEELRLSQDELSYLETHCKYLDHTGYLKFLEAFRFRPSEHVKLAFETSDAGEEGVLDIKIEGLWVDTILYEIPLLALVSEAYFKFVDTDWTYDGQVDNARQKGVRLLENDCKFSEFGTRRRRDYHTQDLVLQGLRDAARNTTTTSGKYVGTSNVHFAMRYQVTPIGTVAHEWFMGLAAYTNDYANATNLALQAWMDCFGLGTLSIALTDTFGTSTFLRAFSNTIPRDRLKGANAWMDTSEPRYADIFDGVRQDSGDPKEFVAMMKQYYEKIGMKDRKSMVFSDSLNVEKCLEYKQISEDAGFNPSFGIGTFLTNDYTHSDGRKSVPLNIVIKLASAAGNPAVKLSDDTGKATGDPPTVQRVKEQVHYIDHHWSGGDETKRWG